MKTRIADIAWGAMIAIMIILAISRFAGVHKRTSAVIPPLTHAATDEYGQTRWY